MSKLILYPKVPREPQDFKNAKRHVVPMQSMTLQEIIKRFVRKESLPIAREGTYAEGFGDLEKIAVEDMTIRDERLAEQRSKVRGMKKALEDQEAAEKAKQASQLNNNPPNVHLQGPTVRNGLAGDGAAGGKPPEAAV